MNIIREYSTLYNTQKMPDANTGASKLLSRVGKETSIENGRLYYYYYYYCSQRTRVFDSTQRSGVTKIIYAVCNLVVV